tara:strand:+ start:414 stop:650 length:237 start_codon:yes stop_codon:yes gene_type:complete
MQKFEIISYSFVDERGPEKPGFVIVKYYIEVPSEIGQTKHNIEGTVRISPDWPKSKDALEAKAKAEIKRVLTKVAESI